MTNFIRENSNKMVELPTDGYVITDTEQEISAFLHSDSQIERILTRRLLCYRSALISAVNQLLEHNFDIVDDWCDLGKYDAAATACGFKVPELEMQEIDITFPEDALQELRQSEKENFIRYGSHYTEEQLKNIEETLWHARGIRASELSLPILPVHCGCEHGIIAEHHRHLDAGQQGQIDAIEILLAESQRSHSSSERKAEQHER
jgi:hypothetical protein